MCFFVSRSFFVGEWGILFWFGFLGFVCLFVVLVLFCLFVFKDDLFHH